MQTDTYANLVKLIQALIGAGTLTLDEHRNIYQLVNRRLTDAYNTTQSWPRYLEQSEKRRIYALNVSGITGGESHVDDPYFIYGEDSNGYKVYREEDTHNEQGGVQSYDIFYYDTSTDKWILAYVAESNLTKDVSTGVVTITSPTTISTADTTGSPSPADVETWTNAAGVNGTLHIRAENLITYTQTGKTNIGEFIRVFRKQAFLNASQLEYDFFLNVEGANILNIRNANDSSAFVTYKKRLALVEITESDPAVVTDYTGDTTDIPKEFFYYIAHSVYADFLRIERRYEQAVQEEALAQNFLAQELEKLDIIANNNNLKKKFSTHLNRNSR